MGGAKQLLAIVLAALVANPVCCCTLPLLLGGAKDAPTCSSCCAEQSSLPDNPEPTSPDDSPSCPCAKSKPALAEGKLLSFEAPLDGVLGLASPAPHPLGDRSRTDFVPVAMTLDAPPPVPLWRKYGRFLL